MKLIDANSNCLFVGDKVRILSVDSCMNIGLEQESIDALLSLINTIKTIREVDELGCIWFQFYDKNQECETDFSLEPKEVLLEKPAKAGMKMNWPSIFGKKEPRRTGNE
ncbi:hypothetical protein [Neisseria sp. Ec49-e6-T10]|uniref:hypothetical protein n=1 Tax=Neisseria sp. Ec49-e6-T10 TaxID=3140744 RepID=UPI003EBB6F87